MIKIGLLTFHRALNYGAVLQAYALQQALNEIGIDNEIIDYRCKMIELQYSLLGEVKLTEKRNLPKNAKKIITRLLHSPKIQLKAIKFRKFHKDYLNLSKRRYFPKGTAKINEEYEQFIVGSDQVWNFQGEYSDTTYLLDFAAKNKLKSTYAPSFGVTDLLDENKEIFKRLLSKFDYLSVRESRGVSIIQELCGITASCVLDPTLLINKQEWRKIEKAPHRGRYILVYTLTNSVTMFQFAEMLSKKYGFALICINDSIIKKCKAEYIRFATPNEWIGLFLNAEYIITNSFHGTAFAINFNKTFFTELWPSPAKVNSRLENILDLFELCDRKIINGKNLNVDNQVNWGRVNMILEKEREKSVTYLKEIVKLKSKVEEQS